MHLFTMSAIRCTSFILISAIILTSCLTSCLASNITPTGSRRCTKGQYLHIQEAKCRPCSQCPANTVVVSSCSGAQDTICAEFVWNEEDLDRFNGGGGNRPTGRGSDGSVKSREEKKKDRNESDVLDNADTTVRDATECFIKAKKEEILIKGLISALVVVTLMFICYVVLTKCCHKPTKTIEEFTVTAVETTPPAETNAAEVEQPFIPPPPELNFVIGPDGTKIPEEHFLRNPLRALTARGRSQVLVTPQPRLKPSTIPQTNQNNDSDTLSSTSETSITIDF